MRIYCVRSLWPPRQINLRIVVGQASPLRPLIECLFAGTTTDGQTWTLNLVRHNARDLHVKILLYRRARRLADDEDSGSDCWKLSYNLVQVNNSYLMRIIGVGQTLLIDLNAIHAKSQEAEKRR